MIINAGICDICEQVVSSYIKHLLIDCLSKLKVFNKVYLDLNFTSTKVFNWLIHYIEGTMPIFLNTVEVA